MKDIDEMEHLDEDGYPTEEALKIIETWDWKTQDIVKLFDFIHSIWYSERWKESEAVSHHGKKYHQYQFSTDGWSGNESIIDAFRKNDFVYNLCLLHYRRGGHYEFDTLYLEDLK